MNKNPIIYVYARLDKPIHAAATPAAPAGFDTVFVASTYEHTLDARQNEINREKAIAEIEALVAGRASIEGFS